MKNQKTELVKTEKIDLKMEAKKQLRIAAIDSLNCARKPAKDFADCAVDYFMTRFIEWVDKKLSA